MLERILKEIKFNDDEIAHIKSCNTKYEKFNFIEDLLIDKTQLDINTFYALILD
jgi:hypothetical protein